MMKDSKPGRSKPEVVITAESLGWVDGRHSATGADVSGLTVVIWVVGGLRNVEHGTGWRAIGERGSHCGYSGTGEFSIVLGTGRVS